MVDRRFLILAVPFSVLGIQVLIFSQFTIDDAYITFSYSKNLIEGNGLVLTPGQRVEATSSMLWALLLSPFQIVSPTGAVAGSKVLGGLSAIATVVASIFLLIELSGCRSRWLLPSVVLASLLAGASPFIVWSVFGMENGLVALILSLATLLFLRELRVSGSASAGLIALLQVVRPEGFILIFVFLVFRALSVAVIKKPWLWFVKWAAILSIIVVPYEAFGLVFYGALLPNTVAAKVGENFWQQAWLGLAYLRRGCGIIYLALVTLCAQFVAAMALIPWQIEQNEVGESEDSVHRWSQWMPYCLILTLVITQFAFAVAVGGDWMINSRFLSHIIPLLLVLLIALFWRLTELHHFFHLGFRHSIFGTLLGLNFIGFFLLTNFICSKNSYQWQERLEQSEERALLGLVEFLNSRTTDRNTIVAASDIGILSYYFKGTVLDWWGLADRNIALSNQSEGRINPQTILNREPKYIVLYSPSRVFDIATPSTWIGDEASKRIFQAEEFQRNYLQINAFFFWENRWHLLFERR